jgi:predicted RNase H-like HicB family nuclease
MQSDVQRSSGRSDGGSYPVEVRLDADGFVVTVPDLPSVTERDNTFSEVLSWARKL